MVKRHRVARARFRIHSGYVVLLHYGSSLVKYTRRGVRVDDNVTFGSICARKLSPLLQCYTALQAHHIAMIYFLRYNAMTTTC